MFFKFNTESFILFRYRQQNTSSDKVLSSIQRDFKIIPEGDTTSHILYLISPWSNLPLTTGDRKGRPYAGGYERKRLFFRLQWNLYFSLIKECFLWLLI